MKPLNIVRTGVVWSLIDLDAASRIGVEPVGHKSSSAYVPPEAVFVDHEQRLVMVKAVGASAGSGSGAVAELPYGVLIAHPSFDVWSLGCILYQLCNPGLKPLFHAGQDDNLTADYDEDGLEEGLLALADWSDELKARKLSKVSDPTACNLISQMLQKDPPARPSLSRVLAHPLLSGKAVVRMVGQQPAFDVFISYRVASDKDVVAKLYDVLIGLGLKVRSCPQRTQPRYSHTVLWVGVVGRQVSEGREQLGGGLL